jgi:phosphohistidine phosphatase SixA
MLGKVVARIKRRSVSRTVTELQVDAIVLKISNEPCAPQVEPLTALHAGGCVLIMRDASAPVERSKHALADAHDTSYERELDEVAKANVQAMGDAMRQGCVKIHRIFSSPRPRARLTAHLLGFVSPEWVGALDEPPQIDADAPSKWLFPNLTNPLPSGTNILIITHLTNILSLFAGRVPCTEAGDGFIIQPDGKVPVRVMAHIPIRDWPKWIGGVQR